MKSPLSKMFSTRLLIQSKKQEHSRDTLTNMVMAENLSSASRIGKSQQYVSQRIRLLNLPKDVLAKVTRHLVTPSHAAELIGLDEEDQKVVSRVITGENISSRTVRDMARRLKGDKNLASQAIAVGRGSSENVYEDNRVSVQKSHWQINCNSENKSNQIRPVIGSNRQRGLDIERVSVPHPSSHT